MTHFLAQTIRPLIGKTITAVDAIHESLVQVDFQDGTTVEISVDGDCCSESIFYQIENRGGVGGVLQDVVEYEKEEADDEEDVIVKIKAGNFDIYIEQLSIWNVVLKTTTGDVLLRHVNSSNGYYDGSTSYRINQPN
jgi:hypothetical protein